MSKLRVLLVGATAAGAFAAASFIPAQADTPVADVVTPIGELHIHGSGPEDGAIIADGDVSNPDPLDGSASLSSDGLCTSDDGRDPGATEDRVDDPNTPDVDESDPNVACNEAIIEGYLEG